jgi:hypothetical protein
MRKAWKRCWTWSALGALFMALASCVDLTHWVQMRERISDAWSGGGCEQ